MMVHGFLVINKPIGLTSNRILTLIKRHFGITGIGHNGTLDPLASGVLLTALGEATKALAFLPPARKRYRARMVLGFSSSTEDLDGIVVGSPPAQPPSREKIQEVLDGLIGKIPQRPPAFSAIKVGGQPAYRLARKGDPTWLPERVVEINGFSDLRLDPGPISIAWRDKKGDEKKFDFCNYYEFLVDCGRGTYVRSLVRDIGERLGCQALLIGLSREQSDHCHLSEAHHLEEVVARGLTPFIVSISRFFADKLPRVVVTGSEVKTLENGASLSLSVPAGQELALVSDVDERIFGFYSRAPNSWRARRILKL